MKRRKEVGKGRAKNLSGDEGEKVERLFLSQTGVFWGYSVSPRPHRP